MSILLLDCPPRVDAQLQTAARLVFLVAAPPSTRGRLIGLSPPGERGRSGSRKQQTSANLKPEAYPVMQKARLAEAPAVRSCNEDSDLGAFGALLGALPKEVLCKVIPAERAVMLRQVSRGSQAALAAV